MPYRSRSQLRILMSGRVKNFPRRTAMEWLEKTPSICCLPEKKGYPPSSNCRPQRKGEKVVGPVLTGPRGGKYFSVSEKDEKGTICEIKIYLKK